MRSPGRWTITSPSGRSDFRATAPACSELVAAPCPLQPTPHRRAWERRNTCGDFWQLTNRRGSRKQTGVARYRHNPWYCALDRRTAGWLLWPRPDQASSAKCQCSSRGRCWSRDTVVCGSGCFATNEYRLSMAVVPVGVALRFRRHVEARESHSNGAGRPHETAANATAAAGAPETAPQAELGRQFPRLYICLWRGGFSRRPHCSYSQVQSGPRATRAAAAP